MLNTAAQTVSIDTFGLTGQLLFRVVPELLVLSVFKAVVHSFQHTEWINLKLLRYCGICTNFMRKGQISHKQLEVFESYEKKTCKASHFSHFGRYCKCTQELVLVLALVLVPSPTKRCLILSFTKGADEVKSCEMKPSVLFTDTFFFF